MKRPEKTYHYRGLIERYSQTGRGYWIEGFSENGENGSIQYPWQGKKVCQSEAKKQGFKAVFKY